MECYICRAEALPGRQLCAECARDYSDYDVAAKRFLASWLRIGGGGPGARSNTDAG